MFKLKKRSEYILFIQCRDFIKISRTITPTYHLMEMQYNCPFDMTIVKQINGDRKVEAEIKDKFIGNLHRGTWYRLEGKLKEYIEKNAP